MHCMHVPTLGGKPMFGPNGGNGGWNDGHRDFVSRLSSSSSPIRPPTPKYGIPPFSISFLRVFRMGFPAYLVQTKRKGNKPSFPPFLSPPSSFAINSVNCSRRREERTTVGEKGKKKAKELQYTQTRKSGLFFLSPSYPFV